MKVERANRIAASFVGGIALRVSRFRCGLLVRYGDCSRYFTQESRFWGYVYALAGISDGPSRPLAGK